MISKIQNFRSFYDWGITAQEKALEFACDNQPNLPSKLYYRAMTIDAPKGDIFPRLCQMRIAPYSYDWLDNFGRKSPEILTPGITKLQLGQVFMTGFELVDFDYNQQVTIRSRDIPAWQFVFGDIILTYMIRPQKKYLNHAIDDLVNTETCRLLVKMRVDCPRNIPMRLLMRALLPPGDTFMMHKQLRNFRRLSESPRN